MELGKHRIGLGVGTKFKTKADRTWNKNQKQIGLGIKLIGTDKTEQNKADGNKNNIQIELGAKQK